MKTDANLKTMVEMFSPEAFRHHGHALIDMLADSLGQQLSGTGQVLYWKSPQEEDQQWRAPLPISPSLDDAGWMAVLGNRILAGNLAIHHPHNMGHQVASPLPLAALSDLVASLSNQAMAVYETGPSATMIERQVIRWLGALIGWEDATGVLTSGGAQANLTALLAARQHTADSDVWTNGVTNHASMCILASEHAHYSVARAAGIMGIGTASVVKVATDAHGRMRPDALQAAHQQAIATHRHVIAVVATAGCTPTGSIDPLHDIGTYCRAHGLWLHVDGAHGASALLSDTYRQALNGIALADSVTWDGHKLLYMPAAVSAVLFRQPETSYAAFAQDASYLFQGEHHADEVFNISYRTLECTKRMMGLKLWTAFSLYGVSGLASLVEQAFENARIFAELISVSSRFELLMPPETNIVCFRFVPEGLDNDALGKHQARIRTAIIESGAFHITQVRLAGTIWLRTTLMNPFIERTHLETLLTTIRETSSSLLA